MKRSTKKLQFLVGSDNWWCALTFARSVWAWFHFTSHFFYNIILYYIISFVFLLFAIATPHTLWPCLPKQLVNPQQGPGHYPNLFLPVPQKFELLLWGAGPCLPHGSYRVMSPKAGAVSQFLFFRMRSIFTGGPVGVAQPPHVLGDKWIQGAVVLSST